MTDPGGSSGGASQWLSVKQTSYFAGQCVLSIKHYQYDSTHERIRVRSDCDTPMAVHTVWRTVWRDGANVLSQSSKSCGSSYTCTWVFNVYDPSGPNNFRVYAEGHATASPNQTAKVGITGYFSS